MVLTNTRSSAESAELSASEGFLSNLWGAALKPEEIASFLMDRDKGGDWRPCVRGLAQTEFAKIMDDSLSWNVIFSDQVVAASNVTMPEGRSRVVNFLASESFKQAGSWSDSEADAAERLIEKDPRLQRVFSRMNSVKNSIGENIRSASLAPILAIVFFVAALCFFCNGLSLSSPQQDFTPGFQQDLPLMGLEKGKWFDSPCPIAHSIMCESTMRQGKALLAYWEILRLFWDILSISKLLMLFLFHSYRRLQDCSTAKNVSAAATCGILWCKNAQSTGVIAG